MNNQSLCPINLSDIQILRIGPWTKVKNFLITVLQIPTQWLTLNQREQCPYDCATNISKMTIKKKKKNNKKFMS